MSGTTHPIAKHCISEDPESSERLYLLENYNQPKLNRRLSLKCTRFEVFMAVKIQMLVPCHSTQDHCSSTTENCLDFSLQSAINILPTFLPRD
jgi:hypothetical protein